MERGDKRGSEAVAAANPTSPFSLSALPHIASGPPRWTPSPTPARPRPCSRPRPARRRRPRFRAASSACAARPRARPPPSLAGGMKRRRRKRRSSFGERQVERRGDGEPRAARIADHPLSPAYSVQQELLARRKTGAWKGEVDTRRAKVSKYLRDPTFKKEVDEERRERLKKEADALPKRTGFRIIVPVNPIGIPEYETERFDLRLPVRRGRGEGVGAARQTPPTPISSTLHSTWTTGGSTPTPTRWPNSSASSSSGGKKRERKGATARARASERAREREESCS